jgi:hypothetical protein
MRRRDMKLLLEERFERIALLETRIDTMDQLVEGYRAREQAIFDTLNAAKQSAATIVEEAQAEATQMRAEADAVLADAAQARENARAEAERLLADAILTANTLIKEAERKGVELSATVKADSERMLRDAEIIKREYEEMVDSFNAMLEQNASELEITAARFAEFVKNRKIDRAEARLDGNAFYKSVGELSDADLPDASGDPSVLMQNIYRIQNRPLPEDRMDAAPQEREQERTEEPPEAPIEARVQAQQAQAQTEEPAASLPVFPMEDGSGADERQTAEPFSEAAWANEAQQSEAEPQAEFVKSFDDAFVNSEFTIYQDECVVLQAETERVFDALVSGEEAASVAAVAIPLGSAAIASDLGAQPQEEAARAFDAYFEEAFVPGGNAANKADAPEQKKEAEAEEALPFTDDTPVGVSAQAAPAPEPYSAQAWEKSAFASELEPQAEGTLFADANELAAEPVSTSEVEHTLDDYLAQMDAFAAPMAGVTAQAAPAPEPYSAQAWEKSAFASELEPQAEGTLFADANGLAAEPVSTSEVEHTLDDYLAQMDAFTAPMAGVTAQAAPAPEPYSAQAWEKSAFASELEPQAEGTLFADANGLAAEPVSTVEPVSTSEVEHTLDDFLTQMNTYAPTMPATPAPEPYSAEAWAHMTASEYEPQAESASFPYATQQEEEPEPAPAPRRYSDYGEIREWEPEPEPEMEDIPTVSRFMGQSGSNDEISLDDLLDEIIRAGES